MTTPQHRPLPSPVDEPMAVSRPGMEPWETSGRTAHWPDGVGTYTLVFHGNKQWSIADEADSAILAMDAIQAGNPNLGEEFIYANLRDIRRLKQRLTAIEEELLLMAREPDDAGDKVSWRDLGEGLGQHHTTVKERHDRIAAGGTHSFRRWLTENTPRADLYPTN
ncbi:hypothetical protein [Streptomyces sp. VN1]|uniref:hypothetical protein n=1 Tax=Streptomyces sp. VN1 TaxID=1821625 RepID=UPI001413BD8D|nr:hypothetical protein [Streptomyces sp. VN1]QIP74759.1 hypothetical protein EZV63_37035 [Streptomyces sp. VN1]